MLSRQTPLFEKLENRQLMAVSPVFAGTKLKGINLSAGGVSTNQTLITVPFTGNVKIANASQIQLRGYAINPLAGGQKKIIIKVVKAEVLAADHRYLQITTDRLMRKGGTVILGSAALMDDNGDTLAAQTVKTVKGQNKERFTLACRGFVPTDLTKFTGNNFTGAPNPSPNGTAVPEATARAQLETFLNKKTTAGTISTVTRTKIMARFDATVTKNIIPDGNMRAALLSLVGTLAEGAIASILDGTNVSGKAYTIVDFDVPPDSSVPVAQTVIASNGRLRTVIKAEFKGEPFQAVSAFLAHEALHQDTNTASLYEEEMGNTAEILAYGQQVLADKTFVSTQSALVNRENERLFAMLESGRTIFPYVGVLRGPIRPNDGGIFTNGKTPATGGAYLSFSDLIEREYLARGASKVSSPGNALLNSYYFNIKGKAAPAGQQFSQALIVDIDGLQLPISTKNAISLAGALRLGVS